jgi:uncharacterized protein (DUF302 family)
MTTNTIAGRAYGFERQLAGAGLDEALNRVTAALAREGFGVLTKIDVKQTLHDKLGVDFHPYLILGACNPVLAHRALGIDSQVGLLLPCNVVIQQTAGGVTVSIADPRAMFTVVDNAALAPIVEEADARLRRAIASV